jgi:hypothetical protein
MFKEHVEKHKVTGTYNLQCSTRRGAMESADDGLRDLRRILNDLEVPYKEKDGGLLVCLAKGPVFGLGAAKWVRPV